MLESSVLESKMAVIRYLDEKIFDPAIAYAKENHDREILTGVNLTRARLLRLPVKKQVQFVWSAIQGTEKSIRFSDKMKEAGLTRFEDIMEDFRVKFGDEFLKGVE